MHEISVLIGSAAVTASVIALLVNGHTRLLVEIEKTTAFFPNVRQLALIRNDRACLDHQSLGPVVCHFNC